MKLLFFSTHGAGAMSIAILCERTGIDLTFPLKGHSGSVATLSTSADLDFVEKLGARTIRNEEELTDRFASGEFDAVMISTPQQVKSYQEDFSRLRPGVPFILRHSINTFTLLNQLGVRNFLAHSRQALLMIPNGHYFLMRKLIPWQRFLEPIEPRQREPAINSYIHHYAKLWPTQHLQFDQVKDELSHRGLLARNFGMGNPDGVVHDLDAMNNSVATLHLKGSGACCNAVIRSLAMGTPVIMDTLTCDRGYHDDTEGLLLRDDPLAIAKEAERLARDFDYRSEVLASTYAKARRQFTWDEDLGNRFRLFLDNLR